MRVADYIYLQLAQWGVREVFTVTGGGAMHLNDALGRQKRVRYICNLHEQACAMAAEGYARVAGVPGVLTVTSGPGGTNAITGVVGAWMDSVPMLVLSGQVKVANLVSSYPGLQLRQLGDQELNIVDVVRPITKYAATVTRPEEVPQALAHAWQCCRSHRPGPVWLDIPLDVQAAEIPMDESAIRATPPPPIERTTPAAGAVTKAMEVLLRSQRPVIIAGGGVRNAGAMEELLAFAKKHSMPVLTAISGIDLIPTQHPLFFGRPGILGDRAANFIMQNADCLLVLGCRMGIRMIGYAYDKIAREATTIMVDADEGELRKPTFRVDVPVHGDAGLFLQALAELTPLPSKPEWLSYCRKLRERYPWVLAAHRERTDYVSSYFFPELLGRYCGDDEIVVTGNGTAYTSTFQSLPVKSGMRVFANQGCASMGYGLPAAIGAALAGNGRRVCCITGDGSIQMNLQELQTVVNYRLPIKIFVYNNDGYLSIKLTQRAFFGGKLMGADSTSGVVLPKVQALAAAYGIPYRAWHNNCQAAEELPQVLADDFPAIVEVFTDPSEVLGPKAASKKLPDGRMVSAPLEDLYPFLPREEFHGNMIIKPLEEDF